MQTLFVTPDLSIELEAHQWRLLRAPSAEQPPQPLVIADEHGLHFGADFAAQQRLSATLIPSEAVAQIVLGWSSEGRYWQLGFYFNDGLNDSTAESGADSGQMRWCPLVAWPIGEAARHLEFARNAGQSLSSVVQRPFKLLGGEPENASLQPEVSTEPSAPTLPISPDMPSVALLPLPIQVQDWTIKPAAQGIAWHLAKGWETRHIISAGFFLGVAALFLFMALGSLRSGLAAVSPSWLPYAAFVIAVLLVYSALENIGRWIMRQQIIVDDEVGEIRSERLLTGFVDWRIPYNEIDYILISQEPAQSQGRKSRDEPMLIAQDCWIHLHTAEGFSPLLQIEKALGRSWQWETIRRRKPSDERFLLNLSEYDLPLYHAVQHMAERVGVAVYVDLR